VDKSSRLRSKNLKYGIIKLKYSLKVSSANRFCNKTALVRMALKISAQTSSVLVPETGVTINYIAEMSSLQNVRMTLLQV